MTPGPLDREPTPHVTPGPPDRELKMTSPDTTRHADDKDHKRGCIAHPRAQPKRQARHVKWADDLLQEMQQTLLLDDIAASAPIQTTVSDFTHEFPMRALSAPEAEAANAATNCYIAEPQHRLVQKLYTETNKVDEVVVQDRPEYIDTGVKVDHPVKLFRKSITLTPEHGPLAESLCGKDKSISLTGAEFWDLLCKWVDVSSQLCQNALDRKARGKAPQAVSNNEITIGGVSHTISAKLLAIPDSEVFTEKAFGSVYDLRAWWTAVQGGKPPPLIEPLVQSNEQRQCLNATGLKELDSIAPVADRDIFDMMTSSGFDVKTKSDTRMFLLVPNAKIFYNHIEHSIEKVNDELNQNILQGPYIGPPFLPYQTVENSYVVQKDKERRVGRGDAPYNFLWKEHDCSINANINLEDFPEMNLPSVMTFAANVATAQTLFNETNDDRHYQEQLYTDWVSFYRWLVPMLLYFWTQCAILAPGGVLVDAGTFFGSSSAPGLANRVMNVLLYFWAAMILLLLDYVTTWDVTANGGAGGQCDPGTSNMFERCGYSSQDYTDTARTARRLVHGIPYHHATGWDAADATRQWRQRRFNAARTAGLNMRQSIWQSIPYTASGFFDDSQQSGAACFLLIILGTVMRLAELSGVKVSMPKLIRARPGLVGTPILLKKIPRLVSDISWTFTKGLAIALGRELDTINWVIRDSIARVEEAAHRVQHLLDTMSQTACQVLENDLQSAAGLLMYMIAIRPECRALLNSTLCRS
jgi:hypothetical protein